VVELHGNIFRTKCARENRVISTSIDSSASPPICPDCGSYLRPDVVWFGESLPAEALAQALNAVNVCEVFISVGTSALVEPAATLPFIALEKGALLLEINPHETPLTPAASYVLRGNAGEILPRLTAELVR
jgi:NAD-dependent deacetylase